MKITNIIKLIGLNIKQSIDEKIKSIVKKINSYINELEARVNSKYEIYEDMAPQSDIENADVYFDALSWALKNKKIKNVALTGPYGSGKSSVIKSYLKMHPRIKSLNISLATFDVNDENDYDYETLIEKGILKQLFYKIDSNKIPQSRYRKIKNIYWGNYFIIVTVTVGLLLSGIIFCYPDVIGKALNYINHIGQYYEISKIYVCVIVVMFILLFIVVISYVLKWCISKFRIAEISIADKAKFTDDKNENSIFDKALDEIIYFFEMTKYNVVFIEDVDRFNTSEIFVKLRELNTLLNNYDLIKRRIVFVYAIKDDMFNDQERTKFFDFIIPIIPIINSTNSGEKLLEKLKFEKKEDGTEKSTMYDISSKYINLISPFIEDMRLLTNICNEFSIYKQTLDSIKLRDETMFSMMVFKSLYPTEFSKAEAEKGVIKQAFEDKIKFVETKKNDLDNDKERFVTILQNIEKDVLENEQEVKAALIHYLEGNKGQFNYCNIGASRYDYEDIMDDSFDLNLLKKDTRIDIRSHNNMWWSIDSMKNDKNIQRYLSRLDYIKYNKDRENIRKNIDNINNAIEEIHSFSLRELIDKYSSDIIFSDEVQNNKFLIFLLSKGFINEDYADYINYFHPNSITKDEMNFIRKVRMQETGEDWTQTIKNVAQVCARIEDYEFKQIQILNFDIVDYIITKQKGSDKCRFLIEGFLNGNKKYYEFTKKYIERNKNIEIFVPLICSRNCKLWHEIVNDNLLTNDKKFEYLALIFKYADMEDISLQNSNSYIDKNKLIIDENGTLAEPEKRGIAEFIENNKNALVKLSSVPQDIMKAFIKEQKVCFSNIEIEDADKNVLDYIFNNNYYELNMDMLISLFMLYFPDRLNTFKTANYTTIKETNFIPLIDRLAGNAEFNSYVRKFVVEQNENIRESIESVEEILKREFVNDNELCKAVIDHENIIWKDFTGCCVCEEKYKQERKQIWDYILEKDKIMNTWETFVGYYMEYSITNELLEWTEKNIAELIKYDRPDNLTDIIIKDLIIKNISYETFSLIISTYNVEYFDLDLAKFGYDRIEVLVNNRYVPYSHEYLKSMYKVAPEQVVNYLIYNKNEFINDIENVDLEIETVSALIARNCFNELEINSLLRQVSISNVDEALAMEIRKLNIPVEKRIVDRAWELLKVENRYQLLLNQIDIFTIQEISEKLHSLAFEYKQLADISRRHKEFLPIDKYGYNEKLLKKLWNLDYISSYRIDEYYIEDTQKHEKIKKTRYEVWIRKKVA